LSRIAQNYERYEFHDLEFYYRPSQSVFGAQGVQGFVDISATNDAGQNPPSTQQMAEIFRHCPAGPVETAQRCVLRLPKPFMESATKQKHFVRPNGLIPGGADPRLFDCGQIFFWTSGQAAGTQIGELRVRGSVCLINQVLENSTIPHINYSVSMLVNSALTPLASTVQTVLPLADTNVAHGYANNLVVVNNGGSLVLPVGNYLAMWNVLFTFSGNSTNYSAYLNKNAVIQPGTFNTPTISYPSGANPLGQMSGSMYITSNGTDVFQLAVNQTFSTGAATAQGWLTFEAV